MDRMHLPVHLAWSPALLAYSRGLHTHKAHSHLHLDLIIDDAVVDLKHVGFRQVRAIVDAPVVL